MHFGRSPHKPTTSKRSCAKEVSARLDALARTRGIENAVAGDDGAIVRGDGSALGRAAVCLLHNGMRCARAGGRMEVVVERVDSTLRLRIDDGGPGFSEDALEHATERFWRDDPARTHRRAGADASGTGLGLAIARAIVESSGGSLILRIAGRRCVDRDAVSALAPVHIAVIESGYTA